MPIDQTSLLISTVPRPGVSFIAALATVSAFAPLATDMYLPGFKQMAVSFHTDSGHIEATLSSFFLGLAVGQAIYGPMIDSFGRRTPLLSGIAIYMLATIACCWTTNIDLFIGFRVLQAVGGCAGIIIGRAIVNDMFRESESAGVLSLLMMIATIAPIFSPLLGGWILSAHGWQAIFVVMLLFGAMGGSLTWFSLPETLPLTSRHPLSLSEVFKTYGKLCARPSFIIPAMVGGLALSCMFAFITGSAFVLIGIFKVDKQLFGWLFGANALALLLGAQLNRVALRHFKIATILSYSLIINSVAGLALVTVSRTNSLPLFLFPLSCVMTSVGLIAADSAAIAMAASGGHAGSGSALIGVLQCGSGFLVSGLIAVGQNGTSLPMALAIFGCGVVATASWFATGRIRACGAPYA